MMTITIVNKKPEPEWQMLPYDGQIYYVENSDGEKTIRVVSDVRVYGLDCAQNEFSQQNLAGANYRILGKVTGFNVELL